MTKYLYLAYTFLTQFLTIKNTREVSLVGLYNTLSPLFIPKSVRRIGQHRWSIWIGRTAGRKVIRVKSESGDSNGMEEEKKKRKKTKKKEKETKRREIRKKRKQRSRLDVHDASRWIEHPANEAI